MRRSKWREDSKIQFNHPFESYATYPTSPICERGQRGANNNIEYMRLIIAPILKTGETQQYDSSQSCCSSRNIQFDCSVVESFVLEFKDRVKHNHTTDSSWQPRSKGASRLHSRARQGRKSWSVCLKVI